MKALLTKLVLNWLIQSSFSRDVELIPYFAQAYMDLTPCLCIIDLTPRKKVTVHDVPIFPCYIIHALGLNFLMGITESKIRSINRLLSIKSNFVRCSVKG